MKRLVAIAVFTLFALPAYAQRGGSHGGFSGAHSGAGVSAPRGGFSGGRVSAPPFHGGFSSPVRSGPPRFSGGPGRSPGFTSQPPYARPPVRFAGPAPARFAGPPVSGSHRMPYSGPRLRPVSPISTGPRQLNSAP